MAQPLAERLRPRTLDDYIGQQHLVGEGAVLRKMIDAGRIPSFILWGPPGVGKTTLAQIIAHKLETPFYTLSAVTSGVKDVRDVIEKAQKGRFFNEASPILFIDEIHRFSKSQQDSLLGAVEKGIVTQVAATTENPSFEVIRPLLSRCQLYVLKSLEKDDLLKLLDRAIHTDSILKEKHIELKETGALLRYSGGDARKLLNILELVVEAEVKDEIKQLEIVRIGTSGGLQSNTPVGTYVCSARSIGFDGVLNFYAGRNAICNLPMERAFINHMGWSGTLCAPAAYAIHADEELVSRIAANDMVRGITIAGNGFYGPQGRDVRISPADPQQNAKIETFEYDGLHVTNFEMESSAVAGLGKLMGHKATTVCLIIANRIAKEMNTGYKNTIDGLIKTVLDRI